MIRDNIRIHGSYTPEELEDLMDSLRPDPTEPAAEYTPDPSEEETN